ncbi:inhibitor of growth protein 3 [Exaiptasia diaphana]|uniref:Inhibitor of growth protein n=1 Tax=Exaiptasia diaphana TaxID=2652724 RepID=A0A913XNF2_EXADI|nr:inhibitor of growth protein 3 [Exaiptasia diaphana]KXJ10556.1 Inhibitor of growth protein 3 [Exaiptasia diaphana]
MLYLEDFLELIEQLPLELRERFTEMRELDLQVQNSIDDLDIRVKQFFMNCRKAKPEWKEQQYKQIKEEYQKSMEDADEKVLAASQIYDLVDKHLRKLDQELTKFKMELEADNAGITEILEQRSLRLDEPIACPSPVRNNHLTSAFNSQKRKYNQVDVVSNDLTNGDHGLLMPTSYSSYSPLSSYPPMSPSPKVSTPQSPSPSTSLTLGMLGAGSTASGYSLTNTMQPNRRVGSALKTPYSTSSFKGNTDYLGGLGGIPSSSSTGSLNGLPAGSYDTPTPAIPPSLTMPVTPVEPQTQLTVPTATSQKKSTKKKNLASQLVSTATASAQVAAQDAAKATEAVPDFFYDPDEPRYCLCNQVSYGEMVGCDNNDCPIEWFHYGCVGLTDAPKGKWYCPQCASQIKQKRSRHK